MSGKHEVDELPASGTGDQAAATPFALPRNRWDAAIAQQKSPAELLQYRSNLLGSDLTVTNYGGGNTSAKLTQPDPLTGQDTEVLWVKGSGGDIGSMGLDGFATLYLAKLQSLERLYRGLEHEDDMVDYLPHCTFNLNTRAASIDTPLHALLPFAHVDHVHPDAMIALAAAADGEQATQAIWSGSVGWLPWQRPGFDLGLKLRDYVTGYLASQPNLRGVMLAGHGVICWGDTAQACYDNTISLIADAARYLNYRERYQAYYQRCASAQDPAMRDPNPVVILVPGVGRITFAADKTTARLAGEFYGNAINVMRGAEALGGYVGLAEQEAFNIEYWALEEAKLQRMPKPRPLAGKVAVVTGGAGGIGRATALRLLAEGACVMILDYSAEALPAAVTLLEQAADRDRVRAAVCDVTQESQVQEAFDACALAFGGMDILVANAGIASSAPLEETTVELWRKNFDVLAEGYFLTARAAFPLLKQQRGGSIVFIGSKNGLAAATNASAYASAKAASLHLARCLALEGAPHGIRVNTINPDAVIKGSRIWDGDWRKERAGAHGIDAGAELEEHYRNRSLLKRDVLPEDVAEGVYFFASEASAKSTGNMLNVDAGNAQAFTR
ncbi:MAG: bifunctional aldolase/short-chain dehydrogenase [Haliea sp.]|nr:bifunctional aldolase/short-chain dehydrogenase [Haliea sp.]